jgi:hypothetical protein
MWKGAPPQYVLDTSTTTTHGVAAHRGHVGVNFHNGLVVAAERDALMVSIMNYFKQ